MKRIPFLILLIVIYLNGCTMAPKYNRPVAPIPSHWPSGAAYSQEQAKAKAFDVTQLSWQEFFTDTRLKQIIKLALNNNRDLRLAVLKVEKARASYGVQESELFPVLDVSGGLTKQRYSKDFTGYPKQYTANLGITSWEIDFFGRIRSLTKQALEEYLSTQEARRSAQISLISEVAKAYLTIAADSDNLNLAYATLKSQEGVYNLILRKYNLKLVNEIDLYQAQTQVDTARRNVALYTKQVAQDKNALDLLVGSIVSEDLLSVNLSSVAPIRDIFPGLSSEVLLRRPDIMDAEHQLKGAYANIGAARAAFFPSISLTTTLGSASNQFSNLFSAGRDTWLFAPQVVMPIFDANTWAAYRVSDATRKIALAQYEKVIQTAFREVADVLAEQGTVDQQITAQQSIVNSDQEVYRLSSKRYVNGIDSYLNVLDAQQSLYKAQQELIYLQLSKLVNEVKTYAVLGGGGWDEINKRKQDNRDSSEEEVLSLLDPEFRKSER